MVKDDQRSGYNGGVAVFSADYLGTRKIHASIERRDQAQQRYEDAIGWARMSAAHAAGNMSNLRCLIASLVATGNVDEARTIAQRLMQLAPTYRVSTFRERTPLRGEVRDLFAHRLKLAGIPD